LLIAAGVPLGESPVRSGRSLLRVRLVPSLASDGKALVLEVVLPAVVILVLHVFSLAVWLADLRCAVSVVT
jgi:hypothetical protein